MSLFTAIQGAITPSGASAPPIPSQDNVVQDLGLFNWNNAGNPGGPCANYSDDFVSASFLADPPYEVDWVAVLADGETPPRLINIWLDQQTNTTPNNANAAGSARPELVPPS